MPWLSRKKAWNSQDSLLSHESLTVYLNTVNEHALLLTWVVVGLLHLLVTVSLGLFTIPSPSTLGNLGVLFAFFVDLFSVYLLAMWLSNERACDIHPDIANPRQKWINVTVRGLGKSMNLVLPPDATVSMVWHEIRRRHDFYLFKRCEYELFTISRRHQASKLRIEQRLDIIGIENNCLLELRRQPFGGAPDGPATSGSTGDDHEFSARTGKFPSSHPELWKPCPNNKLECIICKKHIHHRYIETHENSNRHQTLLKSFNKTQRDNHEAGEPAHLQGSTENPPSIVPRTEVGKALFGVLSRFRTGTTSQERNDPPGRFTPDPTPASAPSSPGDIDWDAPMLENFAFSPSFAEKTVSNLAEKYAEYSMGDGALDVDSDDEPSPEEPELSDETVESDYVPENDIGTGRAHKKTSTNPDNPWFPWPDKETCVLDILRHVPRSVFSDKENSIIHWALLSLGVKNVPSEHQMKDVNDFLQKLCGVQSIRHKGSLGHIYYTNDLAAILAQEMANPNVRPHLNFLPEDTGKRRAQAWQGRHWLHHMDSELLTPMVRQDPQDYYVFEPAIVNVGCDNCIIMPHRWFRRNGEIWASAWMMDSVVSRPGYVVLEHQNVEVPLSSFIVSFPDFAHTHRMRRLPDPCIIIGVQTERGSNIQAWTKTDPTQGNPWRAKAKNNRVIALPLWLYCDDTSGNQSKKWNKHNSWLFTLGGLPRSLLHQEYSVHFLSTSNKAPPLEMLEGIQQQIDECQSSGIWAWDCVLQEMILVFPSVLSMLGDNPMQSEMAGHIGMNGKMFCRMCAVEGDGMDDDDGDCGHAHDTQSNGGDTSDPDASVYSDGSAASGPSGPRSSKKRKKAGGKGSETMQETVERITRFMRTPHESRKRTRAKTLQELRGQLQDARRIGGFTALKNRRTASGIKDTHLEFFMEQLTNVSKSRKLSKDEKENHMEALLNEFPDDEHMMSPVWLMKGVDPHRDTPVEILHVVLLGFVKYFWRDVIARISSEDKETLIARLSSFDTGGLSIPALSGNTLVKYAGSLTGRDFRAIAQAAPFVLHDLGLPDEKLRAWAALSVLVALVWTPEIEDIDQYLPLLRSSIDYFLECTCALSIRWFNKPKFHVILHLPDHIDNLGPAMLYATEGFESFNAVIRSHSVHSNRHAPSRDIARALAQCSRVRHLLSGGFFLDQRFRSQPGSHHDVSKSNAAIAEAGKSPWLQQVVDPINMNMTWHSIGPEPRKLLEVDDFAVQILRFNRFQLGDGAADADSHTKRPGYSRGLGDWKKFRTTQCQNAVPSGSAARQAFARVDAVSDVRLASQVTIENGDTAKKGSWVLWWKEDTGPTASTRPSLGRVAEIVQIRKHSDTMLGLSQLIVVNEANVGQPHELYNMPQVTLLETLRVLSPKDLLGSVNVQHNCRDLKCIITRTKPVFEEREKTCRRSNEVSHKPGQDYILNTSQLRNSFLLRFFRAQPPQMDRSKIILDAVKVEIDAAKERKKKMPAETGKGKSKAPTIPAHILQQSQPASVVRPKPSHAPRPTPRFHTASAGPSNASAPPASPGFLGQIPQNHASSSTYTYPQFRQYIPASPSTLNSNLYPS